MTPRVSAGRSGVGPQVSRYIAEFDEQLGQTMQLSRSSLRAHRARLASLRQLLLEIGVHDQPPRRRPWSRTLEQRFDEIERIGIKLA